MKPRRHSGGEETTPGHDNANCPEGGWTRRISGKKLRQGRSGAARQTENECGGSGLKHDDYKSTATIPSLRDILSLVEAKDIKELRTRLKLSARKFAERLGTDSKTVIAWEQGDSFPTKKACDAMMKLREDSSPAPPQGRSHPETAPFGALSDPGFWVLVRKLCAYEDLRNQAAKLAEQFEDPGGKS